MNPVDVALMGRFDFGNSDEKWEAIIDTPIRWRILERALDIWHEKKLKDETY